MRLADALAEYCKEDHPEIRTILEEESIRLEPVKYHDLVADLKMALDAAREMQHLSETTLKTIKKMKRMKRDGQEGSEEYNALSRRAEKMTLRMGGQGRIVALLENYNFAND